MAAKKEAQYKLIAESGCIGYRLSSSPNSRHHWAEPTVAWSLYDSMEKSGTEPDVVIGNNFTTKFKRTLITMIGGMKNFRSMHRQELYSSTNGAYRDRWWRKFAARVRVITLKWIKANWSHNRLLLRILTKCCASFDIARGATIRMCRNSNRFIAA